MTGGPTRGAGEGGSRTWTSRPGLARVVKVVIVVLPLAAGMGLATFVGRDLWRPSGTAGTALWVLQLAVVSTATIMVVDRFARRLLPLAGLLNLSLVFPDEAPSRFGVALTSGTTKRLRAALDERPPDETVNQAAARLLGLVAELNRHDRLTRGHTERVRAYSDLIAEELGLDDDDRWKLRWAVLLHDIGKLTVPPEILNKPTKLTEDEWAVMSGHPAAGAAMVEPLADWLGEWRLATGEHHERWDGTGYPHGLAGEEISLAGRIVAVADAYDVITSARSYKKPMEPVVAREELVRCAGTQFDPQVVRAFVQVSLGRLRLVGGPLASVASMPIIGNLPGAVAAAAGNAAVAASVVAATAVGGVAAPAPAPTPTPVVAAAPATSAPAPTPTSLPRSTPTTSGSRSPRAVSPTTTAPPVTTDGPPLRTVGSIDTGTNGGSNTTVPRAGTVPTTGRTTPPTTAAPAPTTTRPAPTTTRPAPTTTQPPPTTVAAVAPTIGSDRASAASGAQANLAVLANDASGGVPLDPATLTITSPPAHASIYAVTGHGTIVYASDPAFSGTDSLQYRVCNIDGLCATGTVTIAVS